MFTVKSHFLTRYSSRIVETKVYLPGTCTEVQQEDGLSWPTLSGFQDNCTCKYLNSTCDNNYTWDQLLKKYYFSNGSHCYEASDKLYSKSHCRAIFTLSKAHNIELSQEQATVIKYVEGYDKMLSQINNTETVLISLLSLDPESPLNEIQERVLTTSTKLSDSIFMTALT